MPAKRSSKQGAAQAVNFKAVPYAVGTWTIIRLPQEASAKLSSRGLVMVEGTMNGVPFQTPLEPDGRLSHWFPIDAKLQKAANVGVGDNISISVTLTKDWPEPEVPADWKRALATHPAAQALWQSVTPMARWEWIRWARATNNNETRKKRIEVGCSKLESGERRPCCWNRNLCTEPAVSKSGILLDAGPEAG